MNSTTNGVAGDLYISIGLPICSIFPWLVIIISSATSTASSWSCVTNMLVIPSLVTILRSHVLSSVLTFASIAANGSSNRSTDGLGANALAKATLCLCPPDNWLGYLFSRPASPVISRSSVTLFLISSFGTFLSLSPNAILS